MRRDKTLGAGAFIGFIMMSAGIMFLKLGLGLEQFENNRMNWMTITGIVMLGCLLLAICAVFCRHYVESRTRHYVESRTNRALPCNAYLSRVRYPTAQVHRGISLSGIQRRNASMTEANQGRCAAIEASNGNVSCQNFQYDDMPPAYDMSPAYTNYEEPSPAYQRDNPNYEFQLLRDTTQPPNYHTILQRN